MKFLIIIKDSSSKSKDILHVGSRVAAAFSADLSIIYVGRKSKALIESEVSMARQSLSEWNILHPGLEVLHWAFDTLRKFDHIDIDEETQFSPDQLKEDSHRIHLDLPQSSGCVIELVLREGELLQELAKDVDCYKYDLAIIGSPKKKRAAHGLIQFLNTSVFVVKNFNIDHQYAFQLCVDDSKTTKRAVVFAVKVAKHFNSRIKLVTVSKTNFFKPGYRNAHRWAERYLKRMGVDYDSVLISGDPVKVFISEADDDHIIIMGKAKGNELFKFFRGSKPIHTAQSSNCPVILVN